MHTWVDVLLKGGKGGEIVPIVTRTTSVSNRQRYILTELVFTIKG